MDPSADQPKPRASEINPSPEQTGRRLALGDLERKLRELRDHPLPGAKWKVGRYTAKRPAFDPHPGDSEVLDHLYNGIARPENPREYFGYGRATYTEGEEVRDEFDITWADNGELKGIGRKITHTTIYKEPQKSTYWPEGPNIIGRAVEFDMSGVTVGEIRMRSASDSTSNKPDFRFEDRSRAAIDRSV